MKYIHISDYKDCVNWDKEITVLLQLIEQCYLMFLPHQHTAGFSAFYFIYLFISPQTVSVNTGINPLGVSFSQCKMTKPFQAALEIHTS